MHTGVRRTFAHGRPAINTLQLGEYSAFVTVHWNAFDADEQVVRDTWTSYQLLTTPDGWRFLSYTNHF